MRYFGKIQDPKDLITKEYADTSIGGKAAKAELSDIFQTGSTCTEANGIAKGVFFYLDNELVVAKTAIANGATFTLNTNYEPPTAGALNALKSASGNGYCKMPDGTLIQWGTEVLRDQNDRTWGQLYLADFPGFDFPMAFISTPYISLVNVVYNGTATSAIPISVAVSATGVTSFQGVRGTTFNISDIPWNYVAIGRWK